MAIIARGQTTITITEKGDQGAGTVNLYKASYEKPDAPTEFEMPPDGWSFNVPSDEMVVSSISYDSQNEEQWSDNGDGYWVSNPISNNGLAAMTVHFTTNQSQQTIALAIKVSSQKSYDKLYVCNVDTYQQILASDSFLISPSEDTVSTVESSSDFGIIVPTYSNYKVFSGTVDQVLYYQIEDAGRHFMQFYYQKNSSISYGLDNAIVRIIPILPVKIWLSVATLIGGEVSSWSTPVQFAARDGAMGRSLFYRGEFNSSSIYYQDDMRVDVVKYNSLYYYYIGLNCVSSSWSANNWEHFCSDFECLATNLLLAENANIADWVIKDGQITSQSSTINGTPKALLDGVNGGVQFNADVTRYTATGGTETILQTITISSTNGKVEARNSDYQTSYISSQGIFSNRAGIQALPSTSGTELKAAVVALGFGNLQKSAYSSTAAICGLFADSENENSSPAPAWGAYIRKLLIQGMFLGVRRISYTAYLTQYDTFVACYNTGSINIYLPSNPQTGQIIIFSCMNDNVPRIYGNGKYIFVTSSTVSSYVGGSKRGDVSLYIYDGQYWKFCYMSS
ncbi:MAG: hypothetical protein R3Y49_06650 [Rikenellaceae bacterium]